MATELGGSAKPELVWEEDFVLVAFSAEQSTSELLRARNQPSHRPYAGSHHAVAARIKSAAQDPIPTQAKLYAAAASSSDETEAPRRRPRTALV